MSASGRRISSTSGERPVGAAQSARDAGGSETTFESAHAARRWHSRSGGPSFGASSSERSGTIAPSSRHLSWFVASFWVAYISAPAAASRVSATGDDSSAISGRSASERRIATFTSALGDTS